MALCRIVVGVVLLLLPAFVAGQDSKLNWDWRNQEVIGRNDPSVGNTSRLTEPERSSLMDAIVLRLQKPMGDAGYDDDRIREIASTTRIRFVDLGDGQPLLLATSLGLEGGCDGMGNCPLWIFRRTDEGFLSLLTAIAASYTLQPREGDAPSDLVLMHHITPLQSGLQLYHYIDLKLVDAGCFEAKWHKPSDDPTQLSDPDIEPCKQERLNQYGLPTVRPVHPHPDEKNAHPVVIVPAPQTPAPAAQPAAEQPKEQPPAPEPPVQQPGQEAPSAEQPQEQATPTQQAPSADQPKEPSAEGAPSQAPPSSEKPKEQAAEPPAPEPPKSDPSQPPADRKAPDTNSEAPKPEQAQPSANEPAPASDTPNGEQPPAPANQDEPKAGQAQPPNEQRTPDAEQGTPAPKSDEAQPPASEPQAPAEPQPPRDQDKSKADQAQPAPDQQPSNPAPSADKPTEPAPKQDEPRQDAAPAENPQAPPQPPNQQ